MQYVLNVKLISNSVKFKLDIIMQFLTFAEVNIRIEMKVIVLLYD